MRFQLADGLEGSVAAPGPATIGSQDGRAQLLRAVNTLIQRCGMFEVCERAYQTSYGRRTAGWYCGLFERADRAEALRAG